GAGPWDRFALDRLLDRWGATLNSSADPESAELTVWGPATRWKDLLRLLLTSVRAPHLAPSDWDRVRRQILEQQLRERSQPGAGAGLGPNRGLFPPGHPYRENGLGPRSSVARLRTGDLRRVHRRHYAARGSLVVATGSVPLRTLVGEIV